MIRTFGCKETEALFEIADYHRESMSGTKLEPIHPGEILLEDFMKPLECAPRSRRGNRRTDPRACNLRATDPTYVEPAPPESRTTAGETAWLDLSAPTTR